MSKSNKDLIAYIDSIAIRLREQYEEIHARTQEACATLPQEYITRLQWGLAHMHASLREFERDLERHKKALAEEANAS